MESEERILKLNRHPKHLKESKIARMKRRLAAYVKRMQDAMETYQRR